MVINLITGYCSSTQYLDLLLSPHSRRPNLNTMSNLNRSTAVPAFYDQEPGAPPPLPPMLTDQLKLFSCARHSTTLVADEILPSRISTAVPSTQRTKQPQAKDMPGFKLATRPFKNDRSSLPYSKRVSHSHSQTPTPSDSSGSLDSVSDSGSSTSTESLSEESKIPKPPSKPGCPGRGGYTLQEALDWNPKAYTKFKVSDVPSPQHAICS